MQVLESGRSVLARESEDVVVSVPATGRESLRPLLTFDWEMITLRRFDIPGLEGNMTSGGVVEGKRE